MRLCARAWVRACMCVCIGARVHLSGTPAFLAAAETRELQVIARELQVVILTARALYCAAIGPSFKNMRPVSFFFSPGGGLWALCDGVCVADLLGGDVHCLALCGNIGK